MKDQLLTKFPRFVLIYEDQAGELRRFATTKKGRFSAKLRSLEASIAFFRIVLGPMDHWYNESIDFVLPRDHKKMLSHWQVFSSKTELV